jgi:acyl-CoA hydrolase
MEECFSRLWTKPVAWALYFSGLRGVTAKAETRFKNPAPVGAALLITGSIVERARRLVRVRADVQRVDGNKEKLADMVATMYLPDGVTAESSL